MTPAILYTPDGDIPLWRAVRSDRTLLECADASRLAGFLTGGPPVDLPAGAVLRGVAIAGRGAWFDLLDAFGVVRHEWLRLDPQRADQLLCAIAP